MHNLEFTPDEMRAMADAVVSRAIEHLARIADQPCCGDLNAEALCRSLREPAPEHGSALEPVLDTIFNDAVPRSFTSSGPGYLAYIPGGGIYPAALADFIADTTNRYTGVWMAAPALIQLEANALDWLRDWMGFPSTTRGLFTTGGSMATLTAIVCARERHLGAEIRRGTLYTSDQAHHSIVKAAKLAGIMPDRTYSGLGRSLSDAHGRARGNDRCRSAQRVDAVCGDLDRRNDQHRRCRPAGRCGRCL
jgi:aromatic-L-amino-acid/L-tryptophan decarboxylase